MFRFEGLGLRGLGFCVSGLGFRVGTVEIQFLLPIS